MGKKAKKKTVDENDPEALKVRVHKITVVRILEMSTR